MNRDRLAMLGRSTKGQTTPGRLRLFQPYINSLVLAAEARQQRLSDPSTLAALTLVDIGLGAEPLTLFDWAAQLSASSKHRLIGIERDEKYFNSAVRATETFRASSQVQLEIIHGSFALPQRLFPVGVVRIANVWRVYSIEQLWESQSALVPALAPCADVVEINCSPTGDIGTACHWIATEGKLLPQHLLFAFCGDSHGFSPLRFRDWLPRYLRRDCRPGTSIFALLQQWQESWLPHRQSQSVQAFLDSARALAKVNAAVDLSFLEHGLVPIRL